MKTLWRALTLCWLCAICGTAWGEPNRVESVVVSEDGAALLVKVTFKFDIVVAPVPYLDQTGSTISRIVFPFDDMAEEAGVKIDDGRFGTLLRTMVAHIGKRTLVMLDLSKPASYAFHVDHNTCTVRLEGAASRPVPATNASAPRATFQPATTLAVHARGIGARELLGFAAGSARLNLVVGDELPNRRVDFDTAAIAPIALIEQVARDNGLTVRRQGDIVLVASACRFSATLSLPPLTRSQTLISFNFQHVAAGLIVGKSSVLGHELGMNIDSAMLNENANLAMKLRDQLPSDVMLATTLVLGLELQAVGNGGVKLVPNQSVRDCQSHSGQTAISAEAPPRLVPGLSRSCPGNNAGRRCYPLELFELNELVNLGYIRSDGSAPLVALVESQPDHAVYEVQQGEFLGRHDGKVINITDGGIEIEEHIQDANGVWGSRKALLQYH